MADMFRSDDPTTNPAPLAAGLAGVAGTLGQILVLRELLVLFSGNELSAGLVFTAWTVWTAVGGAIGGRWGDRAAGWGGMLPTAAVLTGLLLPVTILAIRAARSLWGVPLGEIIPPAEMAAMAATLPAPFCLGAGGLFSLAWGAFRRRPGGRPIRIYLCESLGAAGAGLVGHFFLLPRLPVLATALLLTVLVIGLSPLLGGGGGRRRAAFGLILAAVAGALLPFVAPALERASRRPQWGPGLVAVRDTPFHNLALLKDGELHTLFANGLWLFSAPDPRSAQWAVHPALLQHPRPRRVLLLGGGVAGLPAEILRHDPGIRIDCVIPDPALLELARRRLPDSLTAPLTSDRVRVVHEDPATFLRGDGSRYDLILMNMGDPLNAEMNRFYTVEWFDRVAGRLADGGIFSFAVSAAPDMLGPSQIRFLRSVARTLHAAFPRVSLLPGDGMRFFAGGPAAPLTDDPAVLIRRLTRRGLDLRYVRPDSLEDRLEPFRLDYFRSVISEPAGDEAGPAGRVNRDFTPTCYFHGLVLWGGQLHPALRETFLALSRIPGTVVFAGAGLVVLAVAGGLSVGRPKCRGTAALRAALAGAIGMVSQIALLLGFQILTGFVYRYLALMVSLYMAGLALGAALLVSRPAEGGPEGASRRLMVIHALVCLYPLMVLGVLTGLHDGGPTAPMIVLPAVALVGGVLGGAHFSQAVAVLAGPGSASAAVGGGVYALDLVGAAIGAILATLFLLPLHGLPVTLGLFALIGLAGLPPVGRRRR